jgi:hypothetical protein
MGSPPFHPRTQPGYRVNTRQLSQAHALTDNQQGRPGNKDGPEMPGPSLIGDAGSLVAACRLIVRRS